MYMMYIFRFVKQWTTCPSYELPKSIQDTWRIGFMISWYKTIRHLSFISLLSRITHAPIQFNLVFHFPFSFRLVTKLLLTSRIIYSGSSTNLRRINSLVFFIGIWIFHFLGLNKLFVSESFQFFKFSLVLFHYWKDILVVDVCGSKSRWVHEVNQETELKEVVEWNEG